MIKTIFLMPTKFNNGNNVPQSLTDSILSEIDDLFGGHTTEGNVIGKYRMADGSFATDESLKVIVGIDENQLATMRSVIANIAYLLKQETIYFEVDRKSEIEFVSPNAEVSLDIFGGNGGNHTVLITA
jgi:hypothetical protein